MVERVNTVENYWGSKRMLGRTAKQSIENRRCQGTVKEIDQAVNIMISSVGPKGIPRERGKNVRNRAFLFQPPSSQNTVLILHASV